MDGDGRPPESEIDRCRSVGELLRTSARVRGERELFRFADQRLTLREFEQQTNRLANALSNLGVSKGDRVAVMLPNGIEFPTAWFGIVKLGAVLVPVNVQYRSTDLTYVLSHSGASMVITNREFLPLIGDVRERCPDLGVVAVLEEAAGPIPAGVEDLHGHMVSASDSIGLDDVRPDDLHSIQYTSGTTGLPKGCMHTHEYQLFMAELTAEYLELRDDDVNLTAQPFYYIDPQWNTTVCIRSAIPLVVLPRFSASTFWRSVKEHGVTIFYVLGTMPVYLVKQPEAPDVERGHRVRMVMCSGIPPQLHRTFEQRWGCPWREAFGMTESGVDLVVPLEDGDSVGSAAVGRPVRTKEARVVDENGDEVPNGTAGELVVRGKPMMLGYYRDPEATSRAMRDGWMHTGDLAYRDEKGYFYLVGRIKEMVRRSAENISATEVESVLCEHEGVQAAAVVPVPDELRGEEVKAFVQLQPGETPDSVAPQAIIEFAGARLAKFKLPRFVEYVDDFPRTPSERIAKHKLLAARKDQRLGAYDVVEGRWIAS